MDVPLLYLLHEMDVFQTIPHSFSLVYLNYWVPLNYCQIQVPPHIRTTFQQSSLLHKAQLLTESTKSVSYCFLLLFFLSLLYKSDYDISIASHANFYNKKALRLSSQSFHLSRRLPIFTRRFQRTILGTSELNFCVRNGNRWNLTVIVTDQYDWFSITFLFYFVQCF